MTYRGFTLIVNLSLFFKLLICVMRPFFQQSISKARWAHRSSMNTINFPSLLSESVSPKRNIFLWKLKEKTPGYMSPLLVLYTVKCLAAVLPVESVKTVVRHKQISATHERSCYLHCTQSGNNNCFDYNHLTSSMGHRCKQAP